LCSRRQTPTPADVLNLQHDQGSAEKRQQVYDFGMTNMTTKPENLLQVQPLIRLQPSENLQEENNDMNGEMNGINRKALDKIKLTNSNDSNIQIHEDKNDESHHEIQEESPDKIKPETMEEEDEAEKISNQRKSLFYRTSQRSNTHVGTFVAKDTKLKINKEFDSANFEDHAGSPSKYKKSNTGLANVGRDINEQRSIFFSDFRQVKIEDQQPHSLEARGDIDPDESRDSDKDHTPSLQKTTPIQGSLMTINLSAKLPDSKIPQFRKPEPIKAFSLQKSSIFVPKPENNGEGYRFDGEVHNGSDEDEPKNTEEGGQDHRFSINNIALTESVNLTGARAILKTQPDVLPEDVLIKLGQIYDPSVLKTDVNDQNPDKVTLNDIIDDHRAIKLDGQILLDHQQLDKLDSNINKFTLNRVSFQFLL